MCSNDLNTDAGMTWLKAFYVLLQFLLLIRIVTRRINEQHMPAIGHHIGVRLKRTEYKAFYLQHS